jgi:5-methylcytosine-specific restriction enzyme subunit McrC
MEDVDGGPVTAETFQRLGYDRNSERYRPAISLARLIILNYQPDVTAGGHDVLAILFDMNKLFEAYVLSQLRRAAVEAGTGVTVRRQDSRLFWRAGSTTREIRPDIVVTLPGGSGGHQTFVLDTKWKVPNGGHPNDEDLKQIYAYNLQFGATRGYLLYPRVDDRPNVSGRFEAPRHDPVIEHHCAMRFVRLFDAEGRLRKDLGAEILAGLGDVQEMVA